MKDLGIKTLIKTWQQRAKTILELQNEQAKAGEYHLAAAYKEKHSMILECIDELKQTIKP